MSIPYASITPLNEPEVLIRLGVCDPVTCLLARTFEIVRKDGIIQARVNGKFLTMDALLDRVERSKLPTHHF